MSSAQPPSNDPARSDDPSHDQPRAEAHALWKLIRAHTTATLLCADRATPLRYVIDGADGTLVCPIESELLNLDDYALMIPEESFDALQLHVAPTLIDQRAGESCDRHLAYHGPSDPSAWIKFQIFSAKGRHPSIGALVADGADLMRPNPLRAVEPKLCKLANSDPQRLARLCNRRAGVVIERPLAVGVDADGMDVRAKFGIVRLEFDPSITDPASAIAQLAGMLDQSP